MIVAAAVSGGADSLLALALLREAGHEVMACHAHFLPPRGEELRIAEGLDRLCAGLGVPFLALDLSREFERLVIAPFIAAYARGETPNPCAHCNRLMKFGLLQDVLLDRGAEAVATGHYARLLPGPDGRPGLWRGLDPVKDQSYFLTLTPRERLERALFPLGTWRKADVPAALAARGLAPPAPRESREICFIEDDDYRRFLVERGASLSGPGPIRLADGTRLGEHQGLWRHTVGQRRGLGLAWREPLYVLGKDAADNALIVGPKAALSVDECATSPLNWLDAPGERPGEFLVQTCYRQGPRPAVIEEGLDGARLRFHAPLPRPTPGQVAALFSSVGHAHAGGLIR